MCVENYIPLACVSTFPAPSSVPDVNDVLIILHVTSSTPPFKPESNGRTTLRY